MLMPWSTQAEERFTLADLLSLAAVNSPLVATAAAQREQAAGALRTDRHYPNPTVDFLAGQSTGRRLGAIDGGNMQGLFTQLVELPGVRRSRISRGEFRLDAAEFSVNTTELVVRAEVKQIFYEILRRRGAASIADVTRKLLEDIRERIRVRVRAGEAPRLDLVRAESEALTAAKNFDSAVLQVREAKYIMRAIVGSVLPEEFEIEGALPPPEVPPPLDALREEMLAKYPALAQAEAEVQSAKARLQLEQRLRTPQPTVLAGFERDPDLDQWRVGLSIPLPIWNQRQGPIAEAAAGVQLSEANTLRQRLQLLRELETAFTLYRIAHRRVEALEGGLIAEAELGQKVAEAAYKLGARGIIEYLDAQRVLARVRNDYNEALFDRQSALVEIERLRALDLEQ
jgi:cobalt-zinc-cadmium efflux system outer membrane protein